MLNRLSFELAERQRYATFLITCLYLNSKHEVWT
jgi:hypothetical protein